MPASLLASIAPPRPHALTTIIWDTIHEEGFQGLYGRCHLTSSYHPYRFASREAAGRFAAAMCERLGYDGFRLDTPGHRPPPFPAGMFDDCEIPF